MDTAGAKEVVAESTGSEISSGARPQQKKEHGQGEGTPAQAVTREREAGWADYFR